MAAGPQGAAEDMVSFLLFFGKLLNKTKKFFICWNDLDTLAKLSKILNFY